MAVKLTKKDAKKTKGTAKNAKPETVELDDQGIVKQTEDGKKEAKKSASTSFLKRGNDAREALLSQEKEIEKVQEIRGSFRNFFLRAGSQATITFLDGGLDKDGLLDMPLMYLHSVYHAGMGNNGERINLVCTQDTEGDCPICAYDKAQLVGCLTVIEHTKYQSADGEVVNPRRLFLPKRQTMRELQEAATELDGLRGYQFKVRRHGKKSPIVGDELELVAERIPEETLTKVFDACSSSKAIDYETELNYFSNEDLHRLGIVEGVSKGANMDRFPNQQSNAAPSAAGNASGLPGAAGSAPGLPSSFEGEL
ncbi:hypothetical protein NVP1215B_094 [Vibrio phage 1.215.B._10N.222.54.F7]|nr:hypothetical protein NVP1215A_094 [Vibrio phage 1.215.A._10N.222.54.F7]AUR96117.1 hypothetical protein NVP1215B_094 [Vibrio phage 1.215.B._10N.222.54.F7]